MARENKRSVTVTREKGPAKVKVWQQFNRRVDRGAVENINLRRFCKRVQSAVTKCSKRHPADRDEGAHKTTLLQSIKRVWKLATNNTRGGQSQNVQTQARNECKLLSDVSHDTPTKEDRLDFSFACEPKSVSFPLSIEPVRLPRPLSTHTTYGTSSISTQTTFAEDTYQSLTARVRDDLQLHDSRSNTESLNTMPLTNCSKTTSETNSHLQQQLSQETAINQYIPVLDDDSISNSSLPSSRSSSQTSGRIRITSSTRAEYERIMKVFFKAHAVRNPIPNAWRTTPPRTYAFRGPSSSRQGVVMDSVVRLNRGISALPTRGTDPRGTSTSASTEVSSPNTTARLRTVASRPPRLPHPGQVKIPRRGPFRDHTVPSSHGRVTSMRSRHNNTLPRGWTSRVPSTTMAASTDATIHVSQSVDESDYMPLLGSSVLSDGDRCNVVDDMDSGPYVIKEDASGEVSKNSCGSVARSEGSMQEVDSVASSDDVWFDVLDVAVVDEPLS